MKDNITYITICVMLLIATGQLLHQISMLEETIETTTKIERSVDSLKHIFTGYLQIEQQYAEAKVQLQETQQQVNRLDSLATQMTDQQEADLLAIRNQLKLLTDKGSRWQIPAYPVDDGIDSLRFTP